jgi:release factor glutamine methyltransferase
VATLLEAAQATVGRADARILLRHALQRDAAWLIAHAGDTVVAGCAEEFRALISRRAAGEPVAYLTATREFYGRSFKVTPAVLIPRPETELLVELALARLPAGKACRVLDMGTGSGCIGVTVAAERPQAQVTLTDASAGALDIARANAAQWASANTTVQHSDWYAALGDARYDLIVANPPYVADGDAHLQQGDLRFEPRTALAAGIDGLRDLRQIIAQVPGHLNPGGWLLLEHGYDQSAACAQLLAAAGLKDIMTAPDLAGIPRVSGGRVA